jgi:hypothetical protein
MLGGLNNEKPPPAGGRLIFLGVGLLSSSSSLIPQCTELKKKKLITFFNHFPQPVVGGNIPFPVLSAVKHHHRRRILRSD